MLSPVVQTQSRRSVRKVAQARHTLYVVRWEGRVPSYSVERAWPVAPDTTVLFTVNAESDLEASSTAAWICAEIANARAAHWIH